MASEMAATGKRTLICPHCHEPASATTRGTAVWDGTDLDDEYINPPVEFTFAQCDRCQNVTIYARENYGAGFESDNPGTVYPEARNLNFGIPEGLRDEWNEARMCFD